MSEENQLLKLQRKSKLESDAVLKKIHRPVQCGTKNQSLKRSTEDFRCFGSGTLSSLFLL